MNHPHIHYPSLQALINTYTNSPLNSRLSPPQKTGCLRAMFLSHGYRTLARHQPSRHHFTVSAMVLSPDLSSFLLCHHRKCQKWIPLGGHLEPNDQSFYDGCLREIEEESAIPRTELVAPTNAHGLVIDLDIHSILPFGSDPEHLHYDLRYLVISNTINIQPPEGDPVRWFALKDAENITGEESTYRLIVKTRHLLTTLCKVD